MIIKVTLNSARFARLTEFLASEKNTAGFLQSHLGEKWLQFRGSEHYNNFASLLHASRTKEYSSEEKVDITLKIAECYTNTSIQDSEFPVPSICLKAFLYSMGMFPVVPAIQDS
ncbi:MAG: hypothetical protein ABIT47_03065 [Candidatus Paceibacterota bacterium]